MRGHDLVIGLRGSRELIARATSVNGIHAQSPIISRLTLWNFPNPVITSLPPGCRERGREGGVNQIKDLERHGLEWGLLSDVQAQPTRRKC